MCDRDRFRRRDDEGFTLIELVVASALMLLASGALITVLVSMNDMSAYQTGRVRALDDLRITAGIFAKDARHAQEVVQADDNSVEMITYVQNGVQKAVRYEVVTDSTTGDRNLERTEAGGAPRLFVIRLTDASIFNFDSTDPASIRNIGLHMETLPSTKYPPVVLETEVSLRNVN